MTGIRTSFHLVIPAHAGIHGLNAPHHMTLLASDRVDHGFPHARE
jgi:hypothetical protein